MNNDFTHSKKYFLKIYTKLHKKDDENIFLHIKKLIFGLPFIARNDEFKENKNNEFNFKINSIEFEIMNIKAACDNKKINV